MVEITQLRDSPEVRDALSDILIETVANGGSVSFMHPLARDTATVRPSHRGRGIAATLMRAAEQLAVQHGRTLLVLDTAVDGGAAGLYEGLGYTLTGEIPDFAFKPHGGLTGTLIYWKRLG